MVGAPLSGAVLDHFGIVTVYGVSATIMVLALATFAVGGRWLGVLRAPLPQAAREQAGEL